MVSAENMWQKSIAIMEDCFIISEYEEEEETVDINCIDNNNLAVKLADNFKNKLKLQLADHNFSEKNNNNYHHRNYPSYLQSLGK